MPFKEVQTLMNADESGKALVEFARLTAQTLVKHSLTRAQIRGIFTEVRQIEALWPTRKAEAARRLNMLKPKLAYQAARSETVKHLRDVLSEAIDEVIKEPAGKARDDRFERFVNFFEAILAYHRAEGGKN